MVRTRQGKGIITTDYIKYYFAIDYLLIVDSIVLTQIYLDLNPVLL